MREILFRGKRCDNGEWAQGYYIKAEHHWHKHGIHKDWIVCGASANGGWFALHNKYAVKAETVGQFTGLTDKNGNRIFEGDILLFGTQKLVVWWNDEAFQWQAKERQTYPCITFDVKQTIDVVWDNIDLGWIAAEVPCVGKMTTGIIGNIHDNPELLENH